MQCLADGGWVCLGPEGRPVAGHDRLIFRMLQEVHPQEVGGWYV